MIASPAERRRGRLLLITSFVVIVIAVIGGGAWYVKPRFESQPPQITVSPGGDAFGTKPLEIQISDQDSGLRAVKATLAQGGTELTLVSEQFDRPEHEKQISVALSKVQGVKEGPAVLRIAVRDASWAHLFKGSETVLERNVTVDLTPPTLELVADDRYVNFGGVGAIVYKASADTAVSGVRIGTRYFPGFAGQVKSHSGYWLALFAHPYDTPPEERPTLVAVDKAGNARELRFGYELKDVRYRKSTIAVSEGFLRDKVAPLAAEGGARDGTPQEVFVAVNHRLRKENEDRITAITSKATPTMLWKDAFVQLPNSKVEANFADQRTYTWNGAPIDTAYHLGYDLSVTKHIPVEAANSGVVAFTGDLGIYGNTVIVDHGLGLFTLYSHLSSIGVKEGDSVTKRQILGNSGETGLAAGDHLHFGVYLDGVAVLPVEWWDQKWIDDNITPKLEGRSGPEIAAAQLPARSARKGGGKRRR